MIVMMAQRWQVSLWYGVLWARQRWLVPAVALLCIVLMKDWPPPSCSK